MRLCALVPGADLSLANPSVLADRRFVGALTTVDNVLEKHPRFLEEVPALQPRVRLHLAKIPAERDNEPAVHHRLCQV